MRGPVSPPLGYSSGTRVRSLKPLSIGCVEGPGMSEFVIEYVRAIQVLDSRGDPTVEVLSLIHI